LGGTSFGALFFPVIILNDFRRGEIDDTGTLTYPDGLARGRHRLEKDDGRFDEEGEVLSPIGFATLIGLPGVLGKRMRIHRYRKIGAGEFRDLPRRFSMRAREVTLKD
jgi:hypothetical protein